MLNKLKTASVLKKSLAVIATALVLSVLTLLMLQPGRKNFDSKEWQTCTNHAERYSMQADFLQRFKVVGMTKEQLIALLGKPDGESDSKLSWDLGQYFGADDSAIDFKMKDDKVTSIDVWGH